MDLQLKDRWFDVAEDSQNKTYGAVIGWAGDYWIFFY